MCVVAIIHKISHMTFLCFVFYFQVLVQRIHYGTTVFYCVVYFHVFFLGGFSFSPIPTKKVLNDNEKLWIYGTYPASIPVEIQQH